jgi:hypothetical protein
VRHRPVEPPRVSSGADEPVVRTGHDDDGQAQLAIAPREGDRGGDQQCAFLGSCADLRRSERQLAREGREMGGNGCRARTANPTWC